jgi:ectoine hydroxylase-related dioxygenase (phytanoyl-CoA dioxygenase family)
MTNFSFKLEPAQREEFQRHGFVALPSIITTEEVAELRAIFDRLFAPPSDGEKPLFYDLTGSDPDAEIGSGAVPQLLHPSHHAPELKSTGAWTAALDMAMQLLDVGEYSRDDLIVRDHAIVKPPGSTGATPWHQDEAYWEDDLQYNELSVWIALQDTTEQMGCMQFIAGSHKGEVAPHHSWENNPNIIALEVDEGHVNSSQAVACPLPAGGATIHHARTLHYTSGNNSDEPRRAFILTVGTPPDKLDAPRDFYWNRKAREYKQHIQEPGDDNQNRNQ